MATSFSYVGQFRGRAYRALCFPFCHYTTTQASARSSRSGTPTFQNVQPPHVIDVKVPRSPVLPSVLPPSAIPPSPVESRRKSGRFSPTKSMEIPVHPLSRQRSLDEDDEALLHLQDPRGGGGSKASRTSRRSSHNPRRHDSPPRDSAPHTPTGGPHPMQDFATPTHTQRHSSRGSAPPSSTKVCVTQQWFRDTAPHQQPTHHSNHVACHHRSPGNPRHTVECGATPHIGCGVRRTEVGRASLWTQTSARDGSRCAGIRPA